MRTRRRGLIMFAVLIIGTALAAAWLLMSGRGPQPPDAGALRNYNVLLITIDTLRVDRVGAYGNPAGLTPTWVLES